MTSTEKQINKNSEDPLSVEIIEHIKQAEVTLLKSLVNVAESDEISKTSSQIQAIINNEQKHLEELTEEEQNIDKQYEVQSDKLKKRCDQLKGELVSQKKAILAHLEEIQNEMIGMKNLLDDLKTTSDFSTKEQMLQKITSQLKTMTSKPVQSGSVKFYPVLESVEILGQLSIDEDLSEINSLPESVIKGKTFDFIILTKDKRNQYCTKGGSQVSITSSTKVLTTVEVRDNNNGSYTVLIKAEEVGKSKLSVYIDGLKIKGSPFEISVIPNQEKPTKIVDCDGTMGNLWGIATAKNNMWAVTDDIKHCVYIFNSQDQLVNKFGQKGSGKGEFNKPMGVAFDSYDHLHVVDGVNHRVQKFDTKGKYLLEFGTKGNGNGELHDPHGITTCKHRDSTSVYIYIADYSNKRISVFQSDGQFHSSFGSDRLSSPRDVAIGTNDQLFVADNHNHQIYIFTTPDGDFVRKFGKKGADEGELYYPLCIATTGNKKILISDQNHCVSILCEDGKFVRCLGFSHIANKGQSKYPHGVAFKSNSIYVTDLMMHRVEIYNLPIKL